MIIEPKNGKVRALAALGLGLAACAGAPVAEAPDPAPLAVPHADRPLIRIDTLLGGPARPVAGSAPVYVGPAQVVRMGSKPPATAARAPRGDRTTLAGRVSSTRLSSLKFEGEDSVREVMRFLSAASGIDILVEQQAEDAVLGAGIEFNLQRDRPITLANALNLLVELAESEIAWTIRDGVVLVTTPDRARSAPRTFVYDVSDLVRGIPSYPGRRMDIAPSGGLSPIDEDLGEPVSVIDEDLLIQLIMDSIDPDGWDRPGNSVTIRDGKLIVTHD